MDNIVVYNNKFVFLLTSASSITTTNFHIFYSTIDVYKI